MRQRAVIDLNSGRLQHKVQLSLLSLICRTNFFQYRGDDTPLPVSRGSNPCQNAFCKTTEQQRAISFNRR